MIHKLEGTEGIGILENARDDLEEFEDFFQEKPWLPPNRIYDHAILLKEGATIPNLKDYSYPHFQKTKIEKLVVDMLTACVDYKALNKVTIPSKFPSHLIDELLNMSGAVIFIELDLKSDYHKIRMKEEDIPKTTFRMNDNHYEYLIMHFRLTNAPSTFQALMNDILKPYLRKFTLVFFFFYDILIYNKDEESHVTTKKGLLII